MNKKWKTASFWMSLTGSVILVLTSMGIKVDSEYVTGIVSAISGVLILLGVLTGSSNESDATTEANVESQVETASGSEEVEQDTKSREH